MIIARRKRKRPHRAATSNATNAMEPEIYRLLGGIVQLFTNAEDVMGLDISKYGLRYTNLLVSQERNAWYAVLI